ncbi:hypothetical protein B0T17DRAFT_394610 [Bombardia bombarda]|uniref:Uncharacterized protein n=1 Tax=Bombardia bombarda TaxID=252184 RepID=A0AA39TMS9_9PEZI|nr:hypothetical protein B0T17DRAFT_394610 [Bombardia bombarda]
MCENHRLLSLVGTLGKDGHLFIFQLFPSSSFPPLLIIVSSRAHANVQVGNMHQANPLMLVAGACAASVCFSFSSFSLLLLLLLLLPTRTVRLIYITHIPPIIPPWGACPLWIGRYPKKKQGKKRVKTATE